MEILTDIVVGLLLGIAISLCMHLVLLTVRSDYKMLEKRLELVEEAVAVLVGFRTDFLGALKTAVEEAKKKQQEDQELQKTKEEET